MPDPPSDPNDQFFLGLDAFDRRLRALETMLGGTGAAPSIPGVIPIGGILPWPMSSPPASFLAANGQFVSKATYAALLGVIGTTYGDGGATFGLPDLRKRVPVGPGTGYNVSENEGLGEGSRGPNHHHTFSGSGSTGTGSTNTAGDHGHSAAGDHSHGSSAGTFVAASEGNTAALGSAGSLRNLVSNFGGLSSGGSHTHPNAGSHSHSVNSMSVSISGSTSGSTPTDAPSFLVVLFVIRAL